MSAWGWFVLVAYIAIALSAPPAWEREDPNAGGSE